MSISWCQQPEIGLPKPDIVFLLTLSQEEFIQRPGFGEERYECVDFQKSVADLYEELYNDGDNWVKINASGSIDEVQERILKVCLKKIKNEMPPLETLKFGSNNEH